MTINSYERNTKPYVANVLIAKPCYSYPEVSKSYLFNN